MSTVQQKTATSNSKEQVAYPIIHGGSHKKNISESNGYGLTPRAGPYPYWGFSQVVRKIAQLQPPKTPVRSS